MTAHVKYTFLGFVLNTLVDEGKHLGLQKTHEYVRNKTIFKWLKSEFGDDVDLSLYSDTELQDISALFYKLSVTVDEERKMGVINNGLCLLIGYCFEAILRTAED